MKSTLILLLLQHIAYIAVSQTTLVNYNGNSWKDPKTWIFQKVPADTNDVVLVKDILINTNAVCRSLTTNGFSITVANGFKLTITGADSSSIADSDSLLSVVKFYYLDGEPINDSTETEQTLYYEYDSLKRLHSILNIQPGWDTSTITYHYRNSEKLPYLVSEHIPCDEANCDNGFDSTFYTYDNLGRVIIDSGFNYLQYEPKYIFRKVDRFDFAAGNRVIQYSKRNNLQVVNTGDTVITYETIVYDTSFYFQTFERGNIVYQTDTLPDGYKDQHFITYDQNINPFYRYSIPLPVFSFEHFMLEDPHQKNNMLKYKQLLDYGTFSEEYTVNAAFRYRPNKLPVESFLYFDDGPDIYLVKYYYSH